MVLTYGDNHSAFEEAGGSCPTISHSLENDPNNAVTYTATGGSIHNSPSWTTDVDYNLALTVYYDDIEDPDNNDDPLEFGYIQLNFQVVNECEDGSLVWLDINDTDNVIDFYSPGILSES